MESNLCTEATVLALDEPGLARVRLQTSGCEGCAGKGTCGLLGTGETELLVSNPLRASAGARVRIRSHSAAEVKIACLVYVAPSISLVVGAVLGQAVLSERLGSPVLAGLVGAVGMLLPSLLPAMWASRKRLFMPEIDRLLEDDSGDS